MTKRVYEDFYELCGKENICAYCGDSADTIDHTVPVSFVNQKPIVSRHFNLMKVHACGECNSLAYDFLHQTFFELRLAIAESFVRKYDRELKTANWSEDEIDEMGKGMIDYIRSASAISRFLRGRLLTLGSSCLPDGIRDNLWEPRIDLPEGEWTGPNHSKKVWQVQRRTDKILKKIWVATHR